MVGGTEEELEDRQEEAANEENDRNNLAMTDDIGGQRGDSQPGDQPPRSRSSHNIGASSR